MARKARKKSKSGIYHIMMRGINRQSIFEEEEDYKRFIETIQKYKEKSGYEVYGYCLMGNHVHILMKIGKEPLEQVMRRIGGSYVYWYNRKYDRIGNLFQDRFKSEPVEDDAYLLTVHRYIHQNPIKAGLVNSLEEYKWSSYYEYVNEGKLVNTDFTLNIFNNDREEAMERFIQYNNESNDDICLDIEKRHRISEAEARTIIKEVCRVKVPFDLQNIDKEIRNVYLKELKEKYRLSIRQIERLTGINRGIVLKA
ncbi:transposase [Wukongibacter baidiensis]|uniref:REP-associated tyrosine transposase n=1 Tax=Wukongibacter baidiensis TaxID=1723361 RepID=UPI003D7F4CC4